MGRFFQWWNDERFGRPQVFAVLLLLLFLSQCLWLVGTQSRADSSELFRIREGLGQWHGGRIAGISAGTQAEIGDGRQSEMALNEGYDANHSALWYLIASAPLLVGMGSLQPEAIPGLRWLAATPFLIFGVLLGGSLWYVSRRLYGNAGGYIALALYCFSPGIIRSSAVWFAQPEIGAAWGAFGAIFTAIAAAHTLYAPREVVVWNWRRILLLGLSLALAIGSQFSLIIVIPVALGFMLYLAPERLTAAAMIWFAACGVGFLLLYASYFFDPRAFFQAVNHAAFLRIAGGAFTMSAAYREMIAQLGQISPALVLGLPVALIVYLAWPRARYFGNTAPLLVAALFLFLGLGTPHYPGLGFQLMAVPFLLVFVAGIAADLLETRRRNLVLACVCGLTAANALWNVWELIRAGRG